MLAFRGMRPPSVRRANTGCSGAAVRAALVAAIILGHPQDILPVQNSDPKKPHHHHSKTARLHEGDHAPPHRDFSPGHRRMLQTLREVADRAARGDLYLGDGVVRKFRRQLEELDQSPSVPGTPSYWMDLNRWNVLLELGVAEVRFGEEKAGIEHLKAAYNLLPSVRDRLQRSRVDQTIFELGVAYMRMGETQNCVVQHGAERCILPLRGEGIHALPEGSTQAIRYFTEVLESSPSGKDYGYYFPSLWLLNVAYMTLDQYPDGVPARYRIPESKFQTRIPFQRFRNISQKLGLDSFNLAGGAIVDDFDGDGYLDILTSTWDLSGPMVYFRNNADGTFREISSEAGLEGIWGGLNLLQADYDNDGHVDVLVLRGAWSGKEGEQPNSLLRNRGDGTFQDVTYEAGLAEVSYPTQVAGWADYDNDGDLDLFVGNESLGDYRAPWQLFRNQGDGTFQDVAAQAGVRNYFFTKGVAWGDYDGDRYPDLYVSNYRDPNRLFRNRGDGTFEDVTAKMKVEGPEESFPAWFWDYNNDGHLDLFVSSYAGHIGHQARHHIGLPPDFEQARLYEGNGQGGFRDVARERNLEVPMQPMGSNFGDLNNDGWLDFYLGTGDPSLASIVPNLMFLNQGGQRFEDVTIAGGFGHLQKGHGVAFADLDNDGDLDVFEQMGGAFPVDGYSDALYENPGTGNHWLAIKLVGRESNASAIGARIRVRIVEGGASRSIYRHVNSGGSFGCNPLRQTIGLGQATSASEVEIFWPTTGKTQRLGEVSSDQLIRVVEGEEGFQRVPLKRFRF